MYRMKNLYPEYIKNYSNSTIRKKLTQLKKKKKTKILNTHFTSPKKIYELQINTRQDA